jgi:hypothetical protein
VEAAQDEATTERVEQGDREALVAAGVLERVEPDEAEPLDRSPAPRLEDGRTRRELVELAGNRVDLVEVGIEDCAEIGTIVAPGQAVELMSQPPDPTRLDEGDDEQDQQREPESGDGRPDVWRDEGVEIDRWVLRADVTRRTRATGGPSLAGGPAPSITIQGNARNRPIGTSRRAGKRRSPRRGRRPMLSSGRSHEPLGVSTDRWRSAPASRPDPASDDLSSVPLRGRPDLPIVRPRA